jgi:hypothetical protein
LAIFLSKKPVNLWLIVTLSSYFSRNFFSETPCHVSNSKYGIYTDKAIFEFRNINICLTMAKKRRKFTQCPNCGYTFEDINNYCPNCGQENHNLNVPVKHLIVEFLEGTLHFDTKIWQTLKLLILKPGSLTEKFNIGQRASYVPPFRLYVFTSIIFFFVMAVYPSSQSNKGVVLSPEVKAMSTVPGSTFQPIRPEASSDSMLMTLEDPYWKQVGTKFKTFTSGGHQSKQLLLKNVSFMMFLLMPFFAFILYLFYSRRNYVEHLMFSIHFHTFFFLLTLVGLAVTFVFKDFDTDTWVFWITLLYLYLAMLHMHKQSYVRTFFKLVPISVLYLISMGSLFMVTLFISIMMS